MRVYETYPDALNELKRDIAELGMRVHPQTMQDKQIADDPGYETIEYNNMMYSVTSPRLKDLDPYVKTLEWCEAEFQERIHFVREENHPQAWTLRPDVW